MIHFLEKHHCPLIEEDRGRMFPKSQKAQTILDTLSSLLDTTSIHYNEPVQHLLLEDDTCIGIKTKNKLTMVTTSSLQPEV